MKREFILPMLHQELDGERQVAIARAAEEAAELTKEAMKALRFGLENRYPETDPTNAEKIVAEFLDLRQALVDAGLLPPRALRALSEDERKKGLAAGVGADDDLAIYFGPAQNGELTLIDGGTVVVIAERETLAKLIEAATILTEGRCE